jgi:hypothetical protein
VVICPLCAAPSPPVKPRRFRLITCHRCDTVFNSKTRRIRRFGLRPLPPGDIGPTGVREPRRPGPLAGAGAAALPLPGADA